jgi:lambda family phage portal protein
MTDLAARIAAAGQPTRLDRVVMAVAPGYAAKRIRSRVDHELRMAMSERAAENLSVWEAAGNDRLRGEKWITSQMTANDALQDELETLVDRAVDLFRNDVFAASAINGRVDNVIGTGIRPQCRVQAERGLLTPRQAEEFRMLSEWYFAKWAEAEGFFAKQRLLERCNAIWGESWLHMADDERPDRPTTLTVQVVSPSRIPIITYSRYQVGENRRLGLRLDALQRPVAAYVRRSLPYDSRQLDLTEDEISLEDILHCYEEQTPGQLRGVPWLAPAMGKLKDLKDFVHANLVAEQVAACYGAFVTGVTDPVLMATGGRVKSNLEDLAPGSVQYLGDGESIQFSDPARPGTTLAPYVEWALHGVAAALRYPYELLAKQFTNNFSGGRLALIDGRITFKNWQYQLIEHVLRKVWARFIDRCVIQGLLPVDPVKYEENRHHFLQHQWIPPGWPWVDPDKEVKADVAAIEAGLTTQTESLAARGRDFDETLQQIEREQRAKAEMEARMIEFRQELGLDDFGDMDDDIDVDDDAPEPTARPNGQPVSEGDMAAQPASTAMLAKYDGINFTPPAGVRAEARKGLAWRREYKRGGTAVGVARARDLSNGKPMSPRTINRIVSFFARHEVDKQGEGFSPGEPGFPSNGRIAWALWGGDPGKAWSEKVQAQMRARDKR